VALAAALAAKRFSQNTGYRKKIAVSRIGARKMKKRILAVLFLFLFPISVRATSLAEIEAEWFERLVTSDSFTFHFLMLNPENFGLSAIEPTWGGGYSRADFDTRNESAALLYEQLKQVDSRKLIHERDIILYRILLQRALLSERLSDFYYYDNPFCAFRGAFVNMPVLLTEFEFRRENDIHTYFALLKSYDDFILSAVEFEKEKSRLGFFMPDFMLDNVIESCEKILESTSLVSTFDARIDAIAWLSSAQKNSFKDENKKLAENYFLPVYEKIIVELSKLRGTGSAEISDSFREYYILLLEEIMGQGYSPEFIIELLDDALDAAHTDLFAGFQHSRTMRDFERSALSKGNIEQNIAYLHELYTSVFPALPEHTLEISVLPAEQMFVSAAGFYLIPAIDDSRNIIRINPAAENSPDILVTLAHESYGGHLLEYVSRDENFKNLRHLFSHGGFTEGLANYGTQRLLLASDFDERLVRFALANATLETLIPARVEIGIFYEGWTAEDIDDFLGYDDLYFAQYLYEACFASRATYLKYAVGEAFFFYIREMMEEILGDDFDEIAFHARILEIGSVPLNILEERIKKPPFGGALCVLM
jgi:uncharacterized protein (DUF885 family)